MRHLGSLLSLNPRTWPIAIKVPLIVALLMLVVSVMVTDRVLRRLEARQETHLKELASAYMDGLSALVSPHVLRHDTWEVFDALERATRGYTGLSLMWTTVVTPSGAIIASSQPVAFPADSQLSQSLTARFPDQREFVLAEDEERAHLRLTLKYQDRVIGAIYADVGISRLLRERREALTTLLLTNALLTLALASLGYLLVRWMIRPIKVLSYHLGRARTESVEPIPAHLMPAKATEFGRLFARYNDMARAQSEREQLAARLAEEEKLASLGRLTSGIAHEINNPLGGLFNAIDTLRKHGDNQSVRTTSISLLERGLTGIRDVVRAALHVYRAENGQRELTAADIEDLTLLMGPELKRKRLRLRRRCDLDGAIPLDAAPVRDIALNLLLNACSSTPVDGTISFTVGLQSDDLVLRIADQGSGLPESERAYLESTGAGKAPIEDRAGLGLWMVRRLADELGAVITVSPTSEEGTEIEVAIPFKQTEGLRHVA